MSHTSIDGLGFDAADPFLFTFARPGKCYDNYYLYDHNPPLPHRSRSSSAEFSASHAFLSSPPVLRHRSSSDGQTSPRIRPPPIAETGLRVSSTTPTSPRGAPGQPLVSPRRVRHLPSPVAAAPGYENETTSPRSGQPSTGSETPSENETSTAYENETTQQNASTSYEYETSTAYENETSTAYENERSTTDENERSTTDENESATAYENETSRRHNATDSNAGGYENETTRRVDNDAATGYENEVARRSDQDDDGYDHHFSPPTPGYENEAAGEGNNRQLVAIDDDDDDEEEEEEEEEEDDDDDDSGVMSDETFEVSRLGDGATQPLGFRPVVRDCGYPDDEIELSRSAPSSPVTITRARSPVGLSEREQFESLLPAACDIVAALDPLRQSRFAMLLSTLANGRLFALGLRLFHLALQKVGHNQTCRTQPVDSSSASQASDPPSVPPLSLSSLSQATSQSASNSQSSNSQSSNSQSSNSQSSNSQSSNSQSSNSQSSTSTTRSTVEFGRLRSDGRFTSDDESVPATRSASHPGLSPYRTLSLSLSEPHHELPRRSPSMPLRKTPARERAFGFLQRRPQQWFSSSTAWNAEYQSLLDSESSAEKYHRLSTLGKDFVQSAQMYGRVILSELHLPASQKTIKPVSIGGVAGGEKFLIKSILFKLAKDVAIPSRADLWMYGGREPNHEMAIKAAGQELKGATQYHNCGIRGLRTPLMALITFNGHRLIAQSLVPIGQGTLQYGSCNGGREVLAVNPELNGLMRAAGKKLCLAGHLVRNFADQTTVEICGPGDIEAHKGTDGKFYVIDFGRIMPPAYREAVLREEDKAARVVWSKKLRPELLRTWTGGPLSSDAFTPWGVHDPAFHQQNLLVAKATRYLEDVVVERFAHEQCAKQSRFLGMPVGHVLGKMHSLGINYRYLGKIRDRARQLLREDLSDLLLHEAIARTMKVELRNLFRQRAEQDSFSSEEQARRVALDYLNLSFSGSAESAAYWKTTFRAALVHKFPRALSESELRPFYRLRDALNIPAIVLRLCALSGLSLAPTALDCISAAMKECQEEKRAFYFQFVSCDLIDIAPTVKHMSFIDFCQGMHFVMEMQETPASASAAGARDRLFTNAHDMFLSALARAPDDIYSLFELGKLLFGHAATKTGSQKRGLVKRAFDYLDACLSYDPPPEMREYYALALIGDSHERLVELINTGSVIPPSFFRNAHKAGRQLHASLAERDARSSAQLDAWLERPPVCLSSRSLFLILLEAAKHSPQLLSAIAAKIAGLLRLSLAEPFIDSPLAALFNDMNFAPALSRTSSISELLLSSTSVGADTFARIASHCPHLTHLDVSGCAVDARSLAAVLRACTKLKHLSIAKPGATLDPGLVDVLLAAPSGRLTAVLLPTAVVQQYMNELSESFPNCNFRSFVPVTRQANKLGRSCSPALSPTSLSASASSSSSSSSSSMDSADSAQRTGSLTSSLPMRSSAPPDVLWRTQSVGDISQRYPSSPDIAHSLKNSASPPDCR